jgi:hypothetical protein
MVSSSANEYNGEEMLGLCKFSAFDRTERMNALVLKILAIIATTKDPDELIRILSETIELHSQVSIGHALEKLHSVATIGAELDHGRTGLDALCYHLCGSDCSKGIIALQNVLNNYKNL